MQSPPLYPADFHTRLCPPAPRARRNPRTVSIPQNVGPFARIVFSEMGRQKVRYEDVEWQSGIRIASLKAWRRKNRPGLESLEAVLSVLGYAFVPVPTLEVLPPHIAGTLTQLALKMERDMPATWTALIDIGVEQKLIRMRAEERRAVLAKREARIPKLTRRHVRQTY